MCVLLRGIRSRPLRVLIAVVVLLVLVIVPAPVGAGQDEPPVRWGAIDLVKVRQDSTRIVGWAAAPPGTTPVVRLVVDGEAIPRFEPTQPRVDADLVTPRDVRGWGWDITLDRPVTESICASVVIGGDRHGIQCWSTSGGVMLPALGGGDRIGSRGPLIRYSVEVEAATGHHPESVARIVDGILADPRSWAANGEVRLQRVAVDRADLQIKLATPATTDRLCLPFRTGGRLSCNVGDVRIVFNNDRWEGAVPHWTASLNDYRGYVVNHEVGHTLDYDEHLPCPGPGELAPIMMQQTKSLDGCLPNPWPFPDVAPASSAAVPPTTAAWWAPEARHGARIW